VSRLIVNIPTENLNDETYIKIMDEVENLRSKQLEHAYEINKLGTNNTLYCLVDSLLSPFQKNKKLNRYVSYVLRKFLKFLQKRDKVLTSYTNVIWTKDVVKSSTLAYPVRRVEYPWSFLNASLDKSMKILDVGSGISQFPIYLASKGHDVTSIDNDEILMKRISPKLAEWSGTKVNYVEGDATKLNFEDNTFDRVFCISVLEHLEEEIVVGKIVNYHKKNLDVMAIREMLRVLKPNGYLILTFDWDENPDNVRSYRLDDIYERILMPFKSNLISSKKPEINWNVLREEHIKAWKSYPPYDYVIDGWAIGAILQKK